MLLYVERWLKASVQLKDGRLEPRTAGTPQGGVVSPLLANLFVHYVFDRWMAKTHPHIVFERYAGDIICHCRTKSEAAARGVPVTAASSEDEDCLFCKDPHWPSSYPVVTFDFLGYPFQPRLAKWPNGKYDVSFLPAVSRSALKEIRKAVRRLIDDHLSRWAQRKFKHLRQRPKRGRTWLAGVVKRTPGLFPHWRLLYANDRMLGEAMGRGGGGCGTFIVHTN